MFSFTEAWTNLNSSLVKAVYYNDSNNSMLVRLDGGKQYIYDNVTRAAANTLVNAKSIGAAYNSFRRNRGRGNGGVAAHDYRVVAATPTKVVGSAQRVDTSRYVPLSAYAEPSQSWDVTFEVFGGTQTSSVNAANLSQAVAEVEKNLSALNLPAKLTGVVVRK